MGRKLKFDEETKIGHYRMPLSKFAQIDSKFRAILKKFEVKPKKVKG